MSIMLPSISCYYNHFNHEPFNFTFIKYEKFIVVNLNAKSVVLTIKQLTSNVRLFQIYKLSLLLTRETDKSYPSTVDRFIASDGRILEVFGTWTRRYWKQSSIEESYEFTNFANSPIGNPLEESEPTIASTNSKIRRFFRYIKYLYKMERLKEPNEIIGEYLKAETTEMFNYFNRYIEHECKVAMLSSIMHTYGSDVYRSVQKFV